MDKEYKRLKLEYNYYKSIALGILAINFVICFGIIQAFPYLVENNQFALGILFIIGFFFLIFLAYYFITFKNKYSQLLENLK